MPFEQTIESVQQHRLPDWYEDAKLGIFIHWGLYSVPAFAPVTGELHKVVEEHGWERFFANNPYAEWYLNSLRFDNNPTSQYHRETYGADFPYERFAEQFNQEVSKWNPDVWATLFERVHARYVVLTTKHHDGFLLWPSQYSPPQKPDYHATRDLVGELTKAVRAKHMKMGFYYSGGLDWLFNEERIDDFRKVYSTINQSDDFIAYVDAHWRELINTHKPEVMWNDIGYPANADLGVLFADYYNSVSDGVINDRFSQVVPERDTIAEEGIVAPPPSPHFDFRTPEYTSFDSIQEKKWETCRGIGFSFGYNRAEDTSTYMSSEEAIRSFIDIVSKNGNLLLNVGPMPDGTIHELQVACLEGLGAWLDVNGDAIFNTRPWQVAETTTDSSVDIRFTQKGNAVYASLLQTPDTTDITLNGLQLIAGTEVTLLGSDRSIEWKQRGSGIQLSLPDTLPDSPAHSIKISPLPVWIG